MKITALYERLSSGDDGCDGDSNSIKIKSYSLIPTQRRRRRLSVRTIAANGGKARGSAHGGILRREATNLSEWVTRF